MAARTRYHRPTDVVAAAAASPWSSSSGSGAGLTPSDEEEEEEGAAAAAGAAAYELEELVAAGESNSSRARMLDEDEDEDIERKPGGSSSSGRSRRASFQLYTPDEERAVVRKFDRRLVLFLAGCYLLSFLDRSNIGNARIAGMETDLQGRPGRTQSHSFEWALAAFYIAYIAFEWMALLWRIVPAHIYVSLVVLSWGVIASLQAVAPSYPVLIALRVLLGIGEAAFTGVPFYLSFFFRRHELAQRTAMFISAAPLATAFAGFLAWAILKLAEHLPIASWRLLFLVEGFPSVIVATIAWSVIPDSPETARYLTPREREVARLRLRHEGPEPSRAASPDHRDPKRGRRRRLDPRAVLSALADPGAWVTAAMFFLANMAYSTMPAFLPTILEAMGHSRLQAEVLSAPPNLVAFGAVLAAARLSDRRRARGPLVVACALLSSAGYAGLALARPLALHPLLRYLAVYPAAAGFFSVVALVIAWNVGNQADEGRRGGGFALLQVVGQCGPLAGARLYPDADAPYFERGMWACAAAMLGVAALALVLRGYLARRNRALDAAGNDDEGIAEEAEGLVSGRAQTGRRHLSAQPNVMDSIYGRFQVPRVPTAYSALVSPVCDSPTDRLDSPLQTGEFPCGRIYTNPGQKTPPEILKQVEKGTLEAKNS
ncbi:major facilitator superfamily domain-containing protein [Xylariomycetidae sp. FL0641]|nr:major facilitator superfamily domain-containing protein [Xylariomycetidae sp. FL0641]